MVLKRNTKKRLAKYSAAAVAAAATGMTAANVHADLLSITGLSLSTSNSLEGFLDIQGFAQGATTFGYAFANSGYSFGNPLGGTATDFMIRAVFSVTTGTAQIGGRNGAKVAAAPYYVTGSGGTGFAQMAVNVGSAFNPPVGATSFVGPSPNSGGSLLLVTWPWQDNGTGMDPGGFASGSGTMAMTFINSQTGFLHNAWLDVSFGDDGLGNLQQTITGIHIDSVGTQVVPEPASGMMLLCLGAAGLATYRRRKSA